MLQPNERTRQMHPIALVLALAIALWPAAAQAHRFGPPWQARVGVNRTTVYAQPDAASTPVGTLERGQIVVVTNQPDDQWSQIADRYVKSTDIVEDVQPWIAEVTAIPVHVDPADGRARRPCPLGSQQPARDAAAHPELITVSVREINVAVRR